MDSAYVVKVWRGAECGSDHLLVKTSIEISYNKHFIYQQQNNKREATKQYNTDSLRDEFISFLYKGRLAQKLDEEINGTTEKMYETLKHKILSFFLLKEAALEAIDIKDRIEHKNSLGTNDLTQLVGEKKNLYLKWLNTKDDED